MRIERNKLIAVTGLTSLLTVGLVNLASAQMIGAPGGPGGSGPIDITAEEQEFSGDAVIARGHVRVLYKDSTILAPQATLFRDAGGNPNKAIFTGHPRLIQGSNKIDAEKLTFEIAINKIVAEGNAHSEVDVPEDENKTPAVAATPVTAPPKPAVEDDEDEDETPAPAPVASAPAAPAKKKGGEKIITDADRQEYDSSTGRFDAIGHVRVNHGDIKVLADKLQLVYGANNKPETALFTGHVTASQNRNSTSADAITYSLSTKRMQATGNVKSKVIQDKTTDTKKPVTDGEPTAKADFFMSPANAAVYHDKHLQAEISKPALDGKAEDSKPIWIFSDAQDYSKDTGRVSAHGNVKVVQGEMYGSGPSIILTRKPDGRADKVYFQGRSQISQPGRRWIADEITFIVDERRVVAQGNSKAMILQNPSASTAVAKKGPLQIMPDIKPATHTKERNERLATPRENRISATKVEATK
jgi:lipopolysaccharide export system protein LptA